MNQVSCPGQGSQPKQTSQVVVEHRLNVLEPLQLWCCLVVMENACIEHQASHHKSANGGSQKLGFIGETPGAPNMEKAGGHLDAVESSTHVAVKDLLAKNRPNHLGTRFDVQGIG